MFDAVKREMRDYYDALGSRFDGNEATKAKIIEKRDLIYREMDDFYAAHRDIHPALLKSRTHTLMAQYFEPKIFLGNPFYFEMGMRERDSWGMSNLAPSHWIRDRIQRRIYEEHPLSQELRQMFSGLYSTKHNPGKAGVCAIPTSFDTDHHTLGYTTLFAVGIRGLAERIHDEKQRCAADRERQAFYEAAEESCSALLAIAEKFALAADRLLTIVKDSRQSRYLEMISRTARRIPANPPETFYEGLAMLLFTREVVATLENIGISQLGHVDRLLGELYERDMEAGRITEEEARELIDLWMLHTDIKFSLKNNSWPETSTCIQLGGCDAMGNPVYNSVTRLFIQEHHWMGLVNPKLNCRYSKRSPNAYLQVIGKAILAGHNNFVLSNDEVIIDGLMKSGVDLADARMYVSGGCQETMIEGFGHTEGAALYVSVPRLLDLFLRADPCVNIIKPIERADSFESFYEQFVCAVKYFLNLMLDQRNVRQQFDKLSQPCPLFSVTQSGCVESGKDYTDGGAKYNFSTIALVGLGTVSDSLYAIKSLVYKQKKLTLKELNHVLEVNWEGYEPLRQEAVALPKYCSNAPDADMLASRFLSDVADHIRTRKNERGGHYIPSLFVYYYFDYFCSCVRATPEGRRNGELLSAGCGPSRLAAIRDITQPLKSMGNMDFAVCAGGSAVLDVKLPAGSNMTPELFAALARVCLQYRCPILQPNVVSQEELIDAKAHPERHKNLIVRISGLSAYFVALTSDVQDEIIARTAYEV